ncbi:neprilysin-1-like [Dermatophagoides pteronyssinus]|uniref:neprilysin-1-like n=1 Tax=Dermatophagoides pteronyssinus TaxID=6956 RepID=UPI003F6685A0
MKVTTTKILAFSSIILSITLLFNNIVHHIYDHDSANDLFCISETCDKYSEKVLKLINNSVDPCDNFYQYACGTMIRDSNNSKIPFFANELKEKVNDQVRYILENGWDQRKKGTNKKIVKSKSLAVEWTIRIYQQCLHRPKPDDAFQTFNKLWKSLPISPELSWPLESNNNSINMNWLDFYAHYSIVFGYEPLFRIGFMMELIPANMIDFRSLENDTHDYHTLYDLVTKNNIGKMSKEKYERIVNKVIDFEDKIINLKKTNKSETSLETLKKIINDTGLNWISFFQITYNVGKSLEKIENSTNLNGDDIIFVEPGDPLVNFFKVIQNTPEHIVLNYLWLKGITYLLNEFQPKNHETCSDIFFSEQFPLCFAIARLYVDYSLKPGSKLKVIHMVNQLKRSAIKSMKQNTLFDNVTRKNVIKKLRTIIDVVGLPELFIVDEYLDKYYGVYGSINQLIADNYCESYAKLLSYYKYLKIRFMKKDDINIEELYTSSPFMINAFYSPLTNHIEIKPTFIRSPLFDAELPFYVNYGKMGYVIGHEITHCFQEYDIPSKGGEKTRMNFNNSSQCFIEQYRNYSEHSYGLFGNISTLNEDIADNGGLRLAYMIYQAELKRIQNLGKQPELLPRLVAKKITIDQIFFLSLAQLYCRTLTRDRLLKLLNIDPHSPSESRVNVCFQNFDKFAESFNCSIGSPMNPEKRCFLLW